MDRETKYRDYDLLHPACRVAFLTLGQALEEAYKKGLTPTLFKPFETYRSPVRQNFILLETKNSKAGAWESAHQYGMAVDFVPFVDMVWSWAEHHDYAFLKMMAARYRLLVPISWDKCHVESPAFGRMRACIG